MKLLGRFVKSTSTLIRQSLLNKYDGIRTIDYGIGIRTIDYEVTIVDNEVSFTMLDRKKGYKWNFYILPYMNYVQIAKDIYVRQYSSIIEYIRGDLANPIRLYL
jgi:hypothetical protein